MAATTYAVHTQNSSQSGTTVAGAWPQVTPNGVGNQNLDLIQIVSKKGGAVLVTVDYAGAVHYNSGAAVTSPVPTNGTRVEVAATNFSPADAATLAQLFADAFTNPSNQDILQVINIGGNIHYYLDATGVAHGS